jgi:hypothetical protein
MIKPLKIVFILLIVAFTGLAFSSAKNNTVTHRGFHNPQQR